MEYSASERELAEELMATKVRVQDLELQVEELSERIGNLVSQLGKLTKVVRQVMSTDNAEPVSAEISSSLSGEVPPPSRGEKASTGNSMDLPVELLQALKLVTEGRSDEAQRLITAQPREVLAQNPGIVALVAAAVRLRRGEIDVARAALDKARSLLDDQRLLRIVKFVEAQLPG